VKAQTGVHDFRLGLKVGWPLILAALAYTALTFDRPHRTAILALILVGTVLAASVVLSPLRRRLESGNTDALMTLWCTSFIGLALALCLLDTGLQSPFVTVFFVSVAFAAAALPIRRVVGIASANLLALCAVGVYEGLGADHSVYALVLWAAGVGATALVGASVSRDRTQRNEALRESQEEIVRRLARVVEFRDNDTGGHVERMSLYSMLIAQELGWSAERCRELRLAAALHDVGKVAVPDAILLKPGRLTPEERAIMQRHCRAGFEMLCGSDSTVLNLAAVVALTHHERYDGAGYPSRLAGDDIPLAGRIVAVADVFDALTSVRVYKDAIAAPEAVAIIREGRGSQFDPEIVDAFLRVHGAGQLADATSAPEEVAPAGVLAGVAV
jgi:HD domain-containing protein